MPEAGPPDSTRPDAVSGGPTRTERLDLLLYVLLAATTLLVWAPLASVGLNLADEGWLVTAVDRLIEGERLYTDIYRSYAPGLYWFFAGIFAVSDADLSMSRWVFLGGLLLIVLGTFRLARSLAPAWAAFAVALLPIFLRAPTHKTFVPLCYLASLLLCRVLVENPRSGRMLFGAGIGFGVVGLFRQEAAAFGLLIGLVSLVVVARRSTADSSVPSIFRRDVVPLALGVAAPWIPAIAILWLDGSLVDAFEQLVLAGARGNAAMFLPFPDPSRIITGPDRLEASLFYLPGLATLVGGLLCWRAWTRDPHSSEAILLGQWTAMALLAHGIFSSRTDLAHLLQALTPTTLILAHAAGWAIRPNADSPRTISRGVAIAVGAWLLLSVIMVSDLPRQYALLRESAPYTVRGSVVRLDPSEVETLTALDRAIRDATEPEHAIFVAPYSPGIYHLCGRRNPSRHDAVLPGYASAEIQAEIIDALDESGARLVVLERIDYDGRPERRLGAYAPELVAHIRGNFEPLTRIGGFTLLKRRFDPPDETPQRPRR